MDQRQEMEFEQFVAGSGRRLLRTAVLLVGDPGHAEDLVQVALERTARHWNSLDGAPEAYARVVLTRLSTDRWRRRSRRVGAVFGQTPEPTTQDLATDVVTRQALHDLFFSAGRFTVLVSGSQGVSDDELVALAGSIQGLPS